MTGRLLLPLGLALLGVLLVRWSARARARRGLGGGVTLALDDLVLYSERLKLVGRPDRIERHGEFLIPEEWKPSAGRVYRSHRLQLGTYFLLLEEAYGSRPPYGVVVVRGGERVRVENSDELRAEDLAVAGKILVTGGRSGGRSR